MTEDWEIKSAEPPLGNTEMQEGSKKAPPLPLAHVLAGGALDQIHGKLQQANLPALVHPGNEGGGGVVFGSQLLGQPAEDDLHGIVHDILLEIRFAEFEAVTENLEA